jgi:metallo-beta-lactamase family protein
MVIDDAVKVGGMRGKPIARAILKRLASQIIPVDYGIWCELPVVGNDGLRAKIKFKPAGHILGSAYVEFDIAGGGNSERVVFSGDLGACD